jgi:hypothetical protein
MAYAVTYPDTFEMIVGETRNLTVDFTQVMALGDAVSTPVVTVINEQFNELVPSAIIGSPFFSSNKLNFTISSAPLRAATSYVVILTGTIVGTGYTISILLEIKVIC